MEIGAKYHKDGKGEFVLWAPLLKAVTLQVVHPRPQHVAMEKDHDGYWKILADDIFPGTRYFYLLECSRQRPDPASFFQPEGVHGPSELVDHMSYQWEDQSWEGIPLGKMILYELHVGTFTPEGTFEAIIQRLNDLVSLGVTTIELMPVTQFPGDRNWGYDGTYPFAVQNSYGGPNALKRLVNACHRQGVAVILDVVYNHLGPEGNYLAEFGPYFTDKYKIAWGKAINFDDAYSDGVRNFFIQNSLYWLHYFHIDALRLDAIHGIYDMRAKHILEELAEEVDQFSARQGRKFYLIAESDLNNPRVIKPREYGGYGIDAQWCDDFHHSLHTLLTKEKTGYYRDFGTIENLQKAFEEGFVLAGGYSLYRKRRHGAPSRDIPARQFVVFSQNHDQVGNRRLGERLSTLVDFESLKLAAGTVFLSPYIPLLFMGEEYGEDAPFFYFVSHSDPELIRAVREGRKKEFQSFKWDQDPPDPQSSETFLASKLKWEKRSEGNHCILLAFYEQLIALRKMIPALHHGDKNCFRMSTIDDKKIVYIHRWYDESHVFGCLSFNQQGTSAFIDIPEGTWEKLLDSSEPTWMGPGSLLPEKITSKKEVVLKPFSFTLYQRKA